MVTRMGLVVKKVSFSSQSGDEIRSRQNEWFSKVRNLRILSLN
ncbi:hypothetical protein NST54_10035 [Caldifermentibacillus hisashii]